MQKAELAKNKAATELSMGWFLKVAIALIALGFVAAVFGLGRMNTEPNGAFSLTNLSAYGSFLQGAVGSLWSLAGLMLIYVAFLGQKLQLLHQNAELEDQQNQFQLQQESLKRQNFEAYFFQLLNFQKDITSQLRFTRRISAATTKDFDGKACFTPLLHDLRNLWVAAKFQLEQRIYSDLKRELGPEGTAKIREIAQQQTNATIESQDLNKTLDEKLFRLTTEQLFHANLWKEIMREIETLAPDRLREQLVSREFVAKCSADAAATTSKYLGHYVRTLYHIFKFVKESDIPAIDKRRYTSLARAQLSADELVLLFYNCLAPVGAKFKPLVEEFGLFEHLDKNTLFENGHDKLYLDPAYV